MRNCGACTLGETTHARLCHHHPDFTYPLLWSQQADDLADTVGSNNMEAANMLYRVATILYDDHKERLRERG